MAVADFVSYRDRIIGACSKAIVGKKDEITLIAVCYLCGGHILLEDVPGTGKTMLFRAFSKATGGSFKRIQFTPDVMPSDVTGINFYNMKTGEFEFRPGPVFADMVLADEINRATPRTQASLLEAMAERQVSVDGTTRELGATFMVAATQNRSEEAGVALRRDTDSIIAEITPVVSAEETLKLRNELDSIELNDIVMGYIMDIIERTRNDSRFHIGASVRGTIALVKTARAYAAFSGRAFVTPDDVKFLAPYVLAHRLHYRTAVGAAETEETFREMLNGVPVPTEV